MTDRLKSALTAAREAGLTGLVCGTCDPVTHEVEVPYLSPLEGYGRGGVSCNRIDCPACDGTGEPTAAEVLMWVAMWQAECNGSLFVFRGGVRAGGARQWGATNEDLSAAALEAVVAEMEVGL